MVKKNIIYYVQSDDKLTEDNRSLIDACMQCITIDYRESNGCDKKALLVALNEILEGICYFSEMCAIIISIDVEPEVVPDEMRKSFIEDLFIAFNYDNEYLVIGLGRGIKLMKEWLYDHYEIKNDYQIMNILEQIFDKYIKS